MRSAEGWGFSKKLWLNWRKVGNFEKKRIEYHEKEKRSEAKRWNVIAVENCYDSLIHMMDSSASASLLFSVDYYYWPTSTKLSLMTKTNVIPLKPLEIVRNGKVHLNRWNRSAFIYDAKALKLKCNMKTKTKTYGDEQNEMVPALFFSFSFLSISATILLFSFFCIQIFAISIKFHYLYR